MNKIGKIFSENTINSVFCSDPFLKSVFLEKVVKKISIPIIYLDFDLLYSGYIISKTLDLPQNVEILRPSQEDWKKILQNVLLKISKKKYLIIIDTLNGLFNFFRSKDAGRAVNANLMLLSCLAKKTDSMLVFVSLAKQKDNSDWVLSPTGRRVIDTKKITKIFLKEEDSEVNLDILETKKENREVRKI